MFSIPAERPTLHCILQAVIPRTTLNLSRHQAVKNIVLNLGVLLSLLINAKRVMSRRFRHRLVHRSTNSTHNIEAKFFGHPLVVIKTKYLSIARLSCATGRRLKPPTRTMKTPLTLRSKPSRAISLRVGLHHTAQMYLRTRIRGHGLVRTRKSMNAGLKRRTTFVTWS